MKTDNWHEFTAAESSNTDDLHHALHDMLIGASNMKHSAITRKAASRAGVSKETAGEWLNMAARYSRRGASIKAANCAAEALHIHNTYGVHDDSYALSTGTLDRVNALVNLYTINITWN